MPELPEVETIRAFLDENVRGKTITAIDLDLPRLIKNTYPVTGFLQDGCQGMRTGTFSVRTRNVYCFELLMRMAEIFV